MSTTTEHLIEQIWVAHVRNPDRTLKQLIGDATCIKYPSQTNRWSGWFKGEYELTENDMLTAFLLLNKVQTTDAERYMHGTKQSV